MSEPELFIRVARLDEASLLLEWRREAAAWLAAVHGSDQWAVPYPEAKLQRWIERGETFMASWAPEEFPIATLTLTSEGDPQLWMREELSSPALYLNKLSVVRCQAGRRIGERLICWARNYTYERGLGFLRLDAWSSNERLHAYYLAQGFQYVRTVEGVSSGALFQVEASRCPGHHVRFRA